MTIAASTPLFRNVFVLCTGRCGSQTFVRACAHFTNYTAGHETRSRDLGPARLDYPSGHIEADNRLAWFLGRLEQRYGDDAFYVHLKRTPEKVAESYDQRWDHRFSLISGYNRSILMKTDFNRGVALDMVDTITANIDVFLESKSQVIKIDIDAPQEGFDEFAKRIGAQGDISAALEEFKVTHNQRKVPEQGSKARVILHPYQMMEQITLLKKRNMRLLARKAAAGKEIAALKSAKIFLESSNESIARKVTEKEQIKDAAEKDLSRLASSLVQVKRKAKKQRQILLVLALPSIVVLAPILLPIYAFKKLFPDVSAKIEKISAYFSAKSKIHSVSYAFELQKEKGTQAATDFLRRDKKMRAMGVVDLFAAMDADSDKSWLSHTNRWGAANQIPQISLTADGGTRFSRMRFAKMPSVPSPDLVTVIIPCFNCQDVVAQSVESILGQTWTNLEIIAVNDASTDETGAVLDALASRDARLRVLHNAVNVGPYVSKNRALQQAQGQYVTGHDGDDISLPERIEKQVQSLHANQAAVATISYMVRLDEAGRFDGPTKSAKRSYDGIARLCPISLMCKTRVLRYLLGGWDCVRFGGDSEMIDRMTRVLGDTFVRDKRIAMLCLSGAASLTNHPVYGINTPTGLSSVRLDYVNSYRVWHGAASKDDLYLPFPHLPRKFDAPKEMLVPAEGLKKVLDLP